MSNFFSENESYLVFFVMLSVWITGYVTIRKLEVGRDKKFELSIRNLAAMSVFLVTYNLYLNVRSNNRIEKNRISYNTLENIRDNFLDPQKELLESYPEGYFLYASMMPEADFGTSMPAHFDTARRAMVETYGSIRVFQAMENFLTTGTYDVTGNYVWLNNFLMWMQSPILQTNWKKLSFNYASDTRQLVQRIIAESEKLKRIRQQKGILINDDYDNISKNFAVKLR